MIAPTAPMAASIFFCLSEFVLKTQPCKKILRTAGIALVEKLCKFAPKKIYGVNIKNKKATSE